MSFDISSFNTTSSLAPFYLIVDHVDWFKRLLPVGVKLIQLRVKDQPVDVIRQHIIEAKALCQQYDAQLVVNDYWQLAIELGCDYVHLGQEDLDVADIAAIKAKGIRLGISTHSQEELERALSFEPDYIALGPIYETILKAMKFGPQGIDKIPEWKKQLGDMPLVAIGGMNPERGELAYTAGADSVAVVTDVLLNDDPELRCQEWLSLKPESELV